MNKSRYDSLFTPFKISETEIKNRFVMCAMGGLLLYKHDGSIPREAIDFYTERAKNGVGLIITRAVIVKPIGLSFNLYDKPEIFEPLRELTDSVHKYGCKIFMQLSAGAGRIIHQTIEQMEVKGIPFKDAFFAPSDDIPNVWYPEIKHRGLSKSEIEEYIITFGKMAEIAKNVGFDGVELHAVHEGYLMDQFTISCMNKRTDEYGGNIENRFRFPCEIIKEIKKTCGNNYPVSVRYSVTSKMTDFGKGAIPNKAYNEFGRDVSEGIVGAQILQQAGCDMLDCDNGSYDSWFWAHPPIYMPECCNIEEAAIIKKYVDIPVVCAGKMDDPDNSVEHLVSGNCDAIGIARALLVDPEYVAKIKDCKAGEIKPCIGCHSGCLGNIEKQNNTGLSCALNPRVLKEKEYQFKKDGLNRKVIIIGAGIAGVEAALLLNKRNFDVTIYEKSNQIGGNYNLASAFSFKSRDKQLLKWYENEINKLGIKIEYNKDVNDASDIPTDIYAVIVATGGYPRKINISDNKIVSAEEAILKSDSIVNKDIMIIGGGLTGCEIALELSHNNRVKVVEMANEILTVDGLCNANRKYIFAAFESNNIETVTSTKCISGTVDGMIVKNEITNREFEIKCDLAVWSTGYIESHEIYETLKSTLNCKNIFLIGDAKQVGNLLTVIRDVYEVVKQL